MQATQMQIYAEVIGYGFFEEVINLTNEILH